MSEIHVAAQMVNWIQRCARCGEVLSDYRNSMIPGVDPACYLCTIVAKLPQPRHVSDLRKRERAELKESAQLPDLSGPRAAAIALGQRKRKRDGPNRGNA